MTIRRLMKVTPTLWRSGRYTARALAELIEHHGISRVLDLREQKPLLAQSTYRRLGVEYLRIPLPERQPIGPDVWPAIRAVLCEKSPLLVHCFQGRYRTGAVIARYRIECQGWSRARAWTDARQCGFHPIGDRHHLVAWLFGDEP